MFRFGGDVCDLRIAEGDLCLIWKIKVSNCSSLLKAVGRLVAWRAEKFSASAKMESKNFEKSYSFLA